jgi:hypothetical protein
MMGGTYHGKKTMLTLIKSTNRLSARKYTREYLDNFPPCERDKMAWYLSHPWNRLWDDSEEVLFPVKEINTSKLVKILEYLEYLGKTQYIGPFLEQCIKDKLTLIPGEE